MKVQIIRSRRKTIQTSVNVDGEVILRVPVRTSQAEIEKVLREEKDWILRHLEKMKERQEKKDLLPPFTNEEIKKLGDQAVHYIPERVAYYAECLHVTYGRITIRNQKTRWGSCSAKGNLNFNCLLMMTPPDIIDYVIVHELCHRLEMNHSPRFWKYVASIMPDYKDKQKWLRENGQVLIDRLE